MDFGDVIIDHLHGALHHDTLTHGLDLDNSHGYSDSINDVPLLSRVTHPCAVDPDPSLRAEAQKRGWKIISLRD